MSGFRIGYREDDPRVVEALDPPQQVIDERDELRALRAQVRMFKIGYVVLFACVLVLLACLVGQSVVFFLR